MPPVSASKAKRQAEKAAKAAAKSEKDGSSKGTTTTNGSSTATPLTNTSAATSVEDLSDMKKLAVATERNASGVLTSDKQSRDIHIDNFTMSFHGRLLVDGAEIVLNYGQRYGLLGENGSGKTTLLEALAHRDVEIPESIDLYLVQGEVEPSEQNGLEYCIESAKKKVARLEKEIEIMSVADEVDEVGLELKYEELEELDPSTFEAKAGAILHGLGFSKTMMHKPTKDLSGGWRMRVALARALFIKPHLLLLDEPTNHLDLEAVVWLEAYLSTYNHILVFTSHSADFMDSVCTNIMDLTHHKKLVYYGGNYSTYVRTKTENETNQMKAYAKQQDEIQHIKKFIASAGTYANLVKQAKSKQKIIDKMEAAGLIQPVTAPRPLSFKFEDVRKLPPPIIALDEVAFSYSGKVEDYLYKGLSLGVDMDSRVAIVGQNGTGKSTLLNLITGALQPTEGTVQRHAGLKLAKYSQHSADQLPYDLSPLEYMERKYKDKFPQKEMQFWRSQIGRFGLSGSHQTAPIRTLSDGLRNRVVFSQLAMENPHVLLLDEPTNHLDVVNIKWVTDYLTSLTQATSIIVSHDSAFLNNVCTDILHLNRFKIKRYPGTLTDFVKRVPEAKAYLELGGGDEDMSFKLPDPPLLDGVKTKEKSLAKMRNVQFTYPGCTEPQLKGISMQLSLSSRVAILGPNGCGKSTLVKLLVGDTEADSGEVWKHPNLVIGYVAQHAFHHIDQHLDKTPLDYMLWRYQTGEDLEEHLKASRQLSEAELAAMKNGEVYVHEGVKRIIEDIVNRKKLKNSFQYEVTFKAMSSADNIWLSRDELIKRGFEKKIMAVDSREAQRLGMNRPLVRREIEKHFADFGLDAEFVSHSGMRGLSGGQKVKVVLAAATWRQPHVIILDEPTNFLDRESLAALINALKTYEGGVALITHSQEFSENVCKEIWRMEGGKLHASGHNWVEGQGSGERIDKKKDGEEEDVFDALGNKVVSAKKAAKLDSAAKRKAKKDRMARRKRGEEVFTDEEEL